MPMNRVQFVQLALLMFALPAQYMLTEWWGSNSETTRSRSLQILMSSFKRFRETYFSLTNWKSWLKTILVRGSKFKFYLNPEKQSCQDNSMDASDNSKGESIAKEVFRYNNVNGYFAQSTTVRSPRPKGLKYRVGQVIKHKKYGYRGVIVGWDETCKAPKTWIEVMHRDDLSMQKRPHYAVLVDSRDRSEVQTTYVAEDNIQIVTNTPVQHPGIWDYFDIYDGAQYHMRPAMQALYPLD